MQTYNPDHYAITYAQKQDYELFYNTEINLRKMLKYPPFCDIILIRFVGKNLDEIKKVSNLIYKNLQKFGTQKNMLVYAPCPSPIDKLKGKYRYRIIVKGKVGTQMLGILYKSIDCKVSDTSITVDINPNSMV